MCTNHDQAIKAYDFQLDPADGDAVRPRLPQRSYDDPFDVVRSGCETGWIVFEIPSGDRAEAVKFTHDDTRQRPASATPSATPASPGSSRLTRKAFRFSPSPLWG